jgi:thioesterase domain-containing protein
MLIQKLKTKIHNEIPLTKLMDINIKEYTKNHLTTTAPLNININDKGTAFAGSLSTLSTISGWGVCWLITQELGFLNSNIVILKNETKFLKPVTKDLYCITKVPSKDEITILKEKLLNKKSGSIKIESSIIENNQKCLELDAIYIIKIN